MEEEVDEDNDNEYSDSIVPIAFNPFIYDLLGVFAYRLGSTKRSCSCWDCLNCDNCDAYYDRYTICLPYYIS